MKQSEIDQISDSFIEAWKEFFGQVIYYVRFLGVSQKDDLYNESKHKIYDYANKIPLHGSIKYSPTEKEIELAGLDKNVNAIITVVTKELEDNNIDIDVTDADFKDLIEIPQKNGKSKLFSITSINKKVQFSDNFIFTKIGVTNYE